MAKPVKGTKADDDLTLLGTDGNDTIQGKDGNDTLKGGKGNDTIDGGNGIDTAVYSGNIANYTIDFKGTGNDKVTVTDNVGTDGTDQLKHVEFLQFNDGIVDIQHGVSWHYLVNAEIDEAAQKPGTEDMINGTGIPATHFGIARNEAAGIELALGVHHRSDGAFDPATGTSFYAPTDANGYADGVLNYTVQAGQAVTGGATPKAEWSFDWSVTTGLNGQTTDLDDFTFKLQYDVNPGAGTDYRTATLEPGGVGSSGHEWRDAGTNLVLFADDAGNGNVTQNSENYGFGQFQGFIQALYGPGAYGPGNGFTGPADFDIVLQAFDQANVLVAQNHIHVHVV
jgi:hypothetical protein